MTIDILFIAKIKLVLRVNMCFSKFERKILDEIPIEEQEKWIFEYDDNDIEKTFTDQKFIEKVRVRVRELYLTTVDSSGFTKE